MLTSEQLIDTMKRIGMEDSGEHKVFGTPLSTLNAEALRYLVSYLWYDARQQKESHDQAMAIWQACNERRRLMEAA